MKMIFHIRKYHVLSLALILLSLNIKAQNYNQLSLKEALEIGLNNNKTVQISH